MYKVVEVEVIYDHNGVSASERTLHRTYDYQDAIYQANLRVSINGFAVHDTIPKSVCIENKVGEREYFSGGPLTEEPDLEIGG